MYMHLTMEYNLIPIKIPDRLCLYKGGILKFIWKRKTGMLRRIFRRKKKVEETTLSSFKSIHKQECYGQRWLHRFAEQKR